MRANENNFVDLIRERREEGILYVIDTYGSLLYSIVQKRLFMTPDGVCNAHAGRCGLYAGAGRSRTI